MNTRWRFLLSLVVVVLGGVWLWQAASARPEEGTDGRWVSARLQEVRFTVPAVGELRAQTSEQLGPPQGSSLWDFKISFMAPEGAQVEAGDTVLRFDTSELARRLEEAVAARDSADTTLEKERSDIDKELREENLAFLEAQARQRRASLKIDVPEGLVANNEALAAQVDLDLAEKEIAYRRNRLEHITRRTQSRLQFLQEDKLRAAAGVAELEGMIEAMTVKAPKGGTVIYRANWQGQKKKVGDSCWKAEKIVELPDLEKMEADGEVDEAAAGGLAIGMPVSLRLDSYPDEEYFGTVHDVSRTVQQRSRSDRRKVVRLSIELQESDPLRMRPGMRFRGHVETGRLEGALVIPVAAVRSGPEGTEARLEAAFGSRWQRVELGRRSGDWVEVVEGLSEGDRVWVREAS
ncbi:MAG: efflux RND transporter periplasmic adaptor subunit [Deltaproteobacteria bacterium]|nr:efflux RND transporter periplasmic adaptor subunit [Deltaproteobacteria bacterium]